MRKTDKNKPGKNVSTEQAMGIVATAMTNIKWRSLDGDHLQSQVAQLSPQELGRRFTDFLKYGCNVSLCVAVKGVAPEIPEGKKWVKIDNAIYVKVTSNGRGGEDWITYLESKGFRLQDSAKDVLRSPDFKPTSGITYTLVIILDTDGVAESHYISSKRIRSYENYGWLTLHPETACLLRDLLSDVELEELGLWWIAAIHEPIKDLNGKKNVLYPVDRRDGGRWLGSSWGRPGRAEGVRGACVFLISQVQN